MTTSDTYAAATQHRIQTFYSAKVIGDYVLFSLPGGWKSCNPLHHVEIAAKAKPQLAAVLGWDDGAALSPLKTTDDEADIPDEINATSPLLFVDTSVLDSHTDLRLKVHKPARGDRILWPTEPWESWGVFACNSVVQLAPTDANYSVDTAARMYYDCVERGNSTADSTSAPASMDTKNHTNTDRLAQDVRGSITRRCPVDQTQA